MPDRHLVFALVLTLTPSLADAQSLARRIGSVRDGTVRFSYAARPDICGDGRDMVRSGDSFVVLPSTRGYGRNDSDFCLAGPVRVAIGRRDGETVSYRVHVGGQWSAAEDDTDLGVVSAPEAARYLLDAATKARGNNARQALAGAVFADSIELTGDLADLARDKRIERDLRQNAVFWIGSYDDAAAARAVRTLAGDESVDEEIRGAAIVALGRDDPSDDDVTWLQRLYPSLSEKLRSDVFLAMSRSDSPRASGWLSDVITNDGESEHTREQALFWLGQGRGSTVDLVRLYARLDRPALRRHFTFVLSQRHDDKAVDKLIDIADHDPDRDVRRQALFWLGQSRDPRALAYLRDLVTR
jgi:HEAT repeat protein